jgi:cell division septum initiation protein DivIVA
VEQTAAPRTDRSDPHCSGRLVLVSSSVHLTAVPAAPAVVEPLDRRRPNVAGDLRTVLQSAPGFRRALLGYDRFQVDTYVQWAEEELAGAGRERDDLLVRYARLRADLDETRRLLSHRPSGRDSLQLSHRLGSILAAAADEADRLRADAAAERAAAAAEAAQVRAEAAAEAERIVGEAVAEAERVLTEASAEADRIATVAERLLDEAEQTSAEARTEAEARLAKVAALQRRAAEEAERMRQDAAAAATTTRLQARDDVLRMLAAAREERRRTEGMGAALRERVERDAAARCATLEAEIRDLERRRALAAVPAQREAPAVVSGEPDRTGRRPVQLLHLGRRRGRD